MPITATEKYPYSPQSYYALNTDNQMNYGPCLENIVYKGLNNPCSNNTNAFENVNSSIAFVPLSFKGNEFCGLETSKTKCGNNCQWKYDEERNELIITGTGEMNNFPTDMNPWFEIKENISSFWGYWNHL